MQLLELTIDDTSPQIFYSPYRDTISTPRLGSSWNPYYNSSGFASSPGQIGVGESYHITSLDGAYLSLKWNGNGIRLSGGTTHSSYNITLDGADFKLNTTSLPIRTLIDISNLPDGDHTITLTAQIPQNQAPRNSSIVFDEAVIRTFARGAPSDSTIRQKTLDTNSISFNGRWSFKPMASGQTFHTSTTTGDRACATFNGTAFILQGMTTLNAGNYSVTLDGITTMLSSQSSYTVLNTTLFFATGLNDSILHYVEVMNNGGNLSLLEDGFRTFVASPGLPAFSSPDTWVTSSDRQPNGGTVAAFALAGILVAILITAGIFFIWRKFRRRRNQSTTWDDKRFMAYTSRFGKAASVGSSRFGRRTRTSYDIASYGAKGDTMTLESPRLEGTKGGDRSGLSIWQRDAVEGNAQGISLPILFKHSVSEIAVSPEAESPESKHPYSTYEPASHWERSAETKKGPPPTQDDVDLDSAALANLKNKGKARQITGAASTTEDYPVKSWSRLSFSPNDLLHGLHVKVSNGKASSRIKTSQGSLSLSLNPSTSLVPGQSSRYRNSSLDQLSPFQVASNPSVRGWGDQPSPSMTSPKSAEAPSLPSVPRSVSESNSNTLMLHHRQSSPRYLLDDHSERYEIDEGPGPIESLPPPPHAYRNQGNSDSRRLTSNSSFRRVVRSLSPRVSEMRAEGSNPKPDRFYADMLAEEQSILEEDRLMTVEAPSTPSGEDSLSSVQFARDVLPSVAPLPSPTGVDVPSEMRNDKLQVEGDIAGLSTQTGTMDRRKLSPILPSLKRTSPFNIRFDWQSEPESRRVSDSSRLRVAPHVAGSAARPDPDAQGGPRSRFRLTPSTYPPNMHSYAPSQLSTDVVTSFLDLTNSSGSSSVRSNTFSIQSVSRIFGDPSSTQSPPPLPPGPSSSWQGGRMAALKSRWSDTTSSAGQRDSGNNTTSSSSGDKSSRRRTYHTSTVPPSIYLTSETPSKIPGRRESSDSSAQFSTENPVHFHPDIESHNNNRDSLRTTDSSTTTQFHTRLLLAGRYPPLPEGTDEASTSSLHSPIPPPDP